MREVGDGFFSGLGRLAFAGAILGAASAAEARGPRTSASATASSQTEPLRVWYRHSGRCPDGGEFIARLERYGRRSVLAGVGDRVDFVVTVDENAEGSSGRLERQSADRTVAIRDVAADSCDEVVQTLALTLDLAFQPAPFSQQQQSALVFQPTLTSESALGEVPAGELGQARGRLWYGGQATLMTGLAGAWMPGISVFVGGDPWASRWALRLSLEGGFSKPDTEVPLSLRLLTVRLEGCRQWAVGALTLGPCVGLSLGALSANGEGAEGGVGRRDVGLWTSAMGHLRGRWQLGPVLAAEGQIGAFAPMPRYRFEGVGGERVATSDALGIKMALGLSFRL